jgi:hypothetical protein
MEDKYSWEGIRLGGFATRCTRQEVVLLRPPRGGGDTPVGRWCCTTLPAHPCTVVVGKNGRHRGRVEGRERGRLGMEKGC